MAVPEMPQPDEHVSARSGDLLRAENEKNTVSREIIQHAIIRVVQRQIVRYTCDFCGEVCGTRENPKSTWYRTRWDAAGKRQSERHYCMKTCHPGLHPSWSLKHVLTCELCYRFAMERKDGMHVRLDKAVLGTLAGIGKPKVKKSWYER